MNKYYISILNDRITKALRDAKNASELTHGYLIGKLREILVNDLILPLLNQNYQIGSGKATDFEGNFSSEIDLCIYSQNLIPPILSSSSRTIEIIPMEAVLKVLEVKSTFSVKDLRETYNKVAIMENELSITPGIHDQRGDGLPTLIIKPHYSIFFFSYNHKDYSPDTVLKKYSKIDPNWESNPLITSICIANKGWLCYTPIGWIHREYDIEQKIHSEIISFLTNLADDLERIEKSRGKPKTSYYLNDTSQLDYFRDEKFAIKPWKHFKIGITKTDIESL